MKHIFIYPMVAVCAAFSVHAAPPQGYYDSLEGKCGAELKAAVKAKVRKHTVISYGDDTWDAFRETDVREVDGRLCWWDMYSSNNVPVSSGHPGMNIEHSVANSCWGGSKNDAYKDLFHLNPSDATANNRKSNFPLGIVVGTPTWTNGVTVVGHPAAGDCGGAKNVYEPHDMYKGDFARVYFYIFTVYDDISWGTYSDKRDAMYDCSAYPSLKPWAYDMLLEWNAKDPVGEKETGRNDAIYGIQKNRNPFIDIPDLAEYIWGGKKDTPFHYDPDNYPVDPEEPDEPDVPDNPDDPGTPGTWQLVRNASELSVSDVYVLVDSKLGFGMTTVLDGKFIAPSAAPVSSVGGVISSVPSDFAMVRLAASGSGYAIGLSATEDAAPQYVCSVNAKTITLSDSPSAEGAEAQVKISADGTATISYGGAGNLYYNPSAPRFTTYSSSGQTPLCFYRKVKEDAVEEMVSDLRLEVWAEGGVLHVPAGASVYDLWGRKVSEAQETALPSGIYIVVRQGSKPLKVAL